MFSCSICDHRKSVLSTEPEYEFRRRKRNSEEMELYGVSNYCSECQLVTFFVNLVNFEGPLRGSLMWKILWAAAENVGKMPLQKSQDTGVQTRALEIDNPFVIVMAPPASRERVGYQEKEAEESSVGFSETDTQFDRVIQNILNTSSDTDSVSSHKVEELTVLYRRQPETKPDYYSSTCRSAGVDHASARRIPPALPHLQCQMNKKMKRLEELVTVGRRLEDKTTKLRMEMAALEMQKQQEEISEWQREADSALASESSWWGAENLKTVFGKWCPERRDKIMEDQANFLLQALAEQSGTKDRESDTDLRSLKDGKTETKVQGTHKYRSGENDPRSRNDQGAVGDSRSLKDHDGVREHCSKKYQKDKRALMDRRKTDNEDNWSMQSQYIASMQAEKDQSETSDNRSHGDQSETKDHRSHRDQSETKDNRSHRDQSETKDNRSHRDQSETKDHRSHRDQSETKDNRSHRDQSETKDNRSHRDQSETKDHRSHRDQSETKDNRSHRDQSETKDNRSHRDQSETKDNRSHRDQSETKDNRSHRDQSETKDNRSHRDQSETKDHRSHRDQSETKDNRSHRDQSETKDHRSHRDQKHEKALKDNKETDNEDDSSMQSLYIRSPRAEKVHKAAWPDTNSFKANEHPINPFESPREKPQTLQICKKPINCPISDECQQRCVISDFSTHVLYDHQNVMLERIDLGQTKTFHLDPRLAKKNRPTCHMVYFVRDMIIDPPRGKMRDVLPVLVMSARMHSCDVSTSKSPTNDSCLEDDTLQFLLIWLCSFKPTNVRVVGTLSVEATCAYGQDSLMVRTARAYDIRAPQDMRTIYRSPSTLIMPYDLVRRITQRGNRSLIVKVKIE
ncbi:uncharacterized protein DDB_G0283697 isoform X2 [Drosophila miranda]|uniref:uncharacterized protein DDB_G0283697 isoform X2 n=1 Tax=Drosophila miranda TaxID=7229 RepID=UPI00143F9749|nr:uncharacterized protein DDB_G0283697 isoform X2 [Drosophila miranda]